MAKYKIQIKPSAVKELNRLPKKDLKKVVVRIQALSEDPRPSGCEKLSGDEKYRIRHGNYRIVYAIQDEILIVFVVKIGHCKDIYKKR